MDTKTTPSHWSLAKKCWLTLVILICGISSIALPDPQYFFNHYLYNLLTLIIVFGYIGLILTIIVRRAKMPPVVSQHLSKCLLCACIYAPLCFFIIGTPFALMLSVSIIAFTFALYGYLKSQQQLPYKTHSKDPANDNQT